MAGWFNFNFIWLHNDALMGWRLLQIQLIVTTTTAAAATQLTCESRESVVPKWDNSSCAIKVTKACCKCAIATHPLGKHGFSIHMNPSYFDTTMNSRANKASREKKGERKGERERDISEVGKVIFGDFDWLTGWLANRRTLSIGPRLLATASLLFLWTLSRSLPIAIIDHH